MRNVSNFIVIWELFTELGIIIVLGESITAFKIVNSSKNIQVLPNFKLICG